MGASLSVNHVAPHQPLEDALRSTLAANADDVDRTGAFPAANIAWLRQSGLLALTVPTAFGGLGGGLQDTARVLGAAAEGCGSTALILAMQLFKIAAVARSHHFGDQAVARIMDDAVTRGGLINALRVEPELGSPNRGGMPATTLRQTAGGWALTGHKIFATGAPGLSWMAVWARCGDEVGYVLVRADAPGIRIVETWDHIGMRGTCSHDVLFEDTPVEPGFAAMQPPGAWANADPAQAAWNAAGIGAIYTGIATAARQWIIHFLRNRVPTGLGAPLATLPRAQEKVGEIEMLLQVNRRLINAIARQTDEGTPTPTSEATLMKAMIVENAIRAVEIAASLAGNHAHAKANAIERHIRDVRSGRVQAPQADAAFIAAGKAALS
jgi:alkylation response protein AidB-like acyl-CoA dehydrogenase